MLAIGVIIANIEMQAADPFELRIKVYPLIIIFNILLLIVLTQILKIRK
jgi:hypothetical protein